MITRSRLQELLHYDPLGGVFTWRVKRGSRAAGQEAGYVEETGLLRIRVDKVPYYAGRLAWLYMYGELPYKVQHRSKNKLDNSIENLYAVKQRRQ